MLIKTCMHVCIHMHMHAHTLTDMHTYIPTALLSIQTQVNRLQVPGPIFCVWHDLTMWERKTCPLPILFLVNDIVHVKYNAAGCEGQTHGRLLLFLHQKRSFGNQGNRSSCQVTVSLRALFMQDVCRGVLQATFFLHFPLALDGLILWLPSQSQKAFPQQVICLKYHSE